MNLTRLPLLSLLTLCAGAAHPQQQAPGFPFPPLPPGLPFIPLAPQPRAVPVNSPGWRAIIDEYGAPVAGPQKKIVEDVIVELSHAAGGVAPNGGYRGTLLDTSVMNAFSIADGNLFLTRQLLAYMNDEDELIGVMGHEVGHVIGGHSRFKSVAYAGDELLGMYLPVIGGMVQNGGTFVLRAVDRSQEHAADVAGVKFLADLGRDPNAMGRALNILEAESRLQDRVFGARPPSALDYWLSDHPVNSERLALVNAASDMAPRGRAGTTRSRAGFIRELDGMVFDDSPEQGIVDGGKFRHPVLKFALDAPAPFRLINGATALLVSAPEGGSAALKMIAGGGVAAERFKAAWAKSFPPEYTAPAPEIVQTGGISSVTGHRDVPVKDSFVRVSLWLYAWSDTQSFIYASLDPKATYASQNAAVAQSFRRLSDAEAAAVQVRYIKVVDLSAADTIASLSKQMAYPDFREERFRLINGIFNGEPLPKSGPVKLVVWGPCNAPCSSGVAANAR